MLHVLRDFPQQLGYTGREFNWKQPRPADWPLADWPLTSAQWRGSDVQEVYTWASKLLASTESAEVLLLKPPAGDGSTTNTSDPKQQATETKQSAAAAAKSAVSPPTTPGQFAGGGIVNSRNDCFMAVDLQGMAHCGEWVETCGQTMSEPGVAALQA